MPWTERKQLAISKDLIESANLAASVLDPDIGGSETFTKATHSADGTAPATHAVAHTQLKQKTYGLLAEGSVAQIADKIESLAKERGRDIFKEPETDNPDTTPEPEMTRTELETVIQNLDIEGGYKEVQEVSGSMNGQVL
jgi:hypothetical protein